MSANKGNSVNAEKIIKGAAVWHQVLLRPEVSSMAWTAHLILLILKGVKLFSLLVLCILYLNFFGQNLLTLWGFCAMKPKPGWFPTLSKHRWSFRIFHCTSVMICKPYNSDRLQQSWTIINQHRGWAALADIFRYAIKYLFIFSPTKLHNEELSLFSCGLPDLCTFRFRTRLKDLNGMGIWKEPSHKYFELHHSLSKCDWE